MLTGQFWKEALERAVKSAAQVAIVAMGADNFNLLNLDPKAVAAATASLFVASILTSIATLSVGARNSPSAVELRK